MNESRLQRLVEDFQDDALNEAECRELIEWFDDQSIELYDVSQDVGERADLSKSMPQKAQELQAKLHRWRESVGAKMPTELNPNYDPDRVHEWKFYGQ